MLWGNSKEQAHEQIRELRHNEEILIDLIPDRFEVSQLSKICGKHRVTIINHLVCNYIEGIGYDRLSNKTRSKIIIPKDTAIKIAKYFFIKSQKRR